MVPIGTEGRLRSTACPEGDLTTPTTRKGRLLFWAPALIALLGCASKPPPHVEAPRPPPPPPVKMAVLPPDTLIFADVASALGDRLARVQVGGATPAVMAKVSMEVAQLSLECVSATDECFAKVGRFLQVDRLLWGQIERDKESGVKVTVAFLDVGRGAVVGRAEGTFAEPAAAIPGLQKLIDDAIRRRATLSQSERPQRSEVRP